MCFWQPNHKALISTSTFRAGAGYPIAFLFPDFRVVRINQCFFPTQKDQQDTGQDQTNNVLDRVIDSGIFNRHREGHNNQGLPEQTQTAIDNIVVLICGHGSRDTRCGILGPLLQAEFRRILPQCGFDDAEVELVSHVGGHKFAGNVIVYVPPSFGRHELSGVGVWYGRVDPGQVERIVRATILEGKIVEDLFRGGLTREAEPLTLTSRSRPSR